MILQCTGVQCTVDFRNSSVKSLDIVFLNEEGNQQVLNVTVRADCKCSRGGWWEVGGEGGVYVSLQ